MPRLSESMPEANRTAVCWSTYRNLAWSVAKHSEYFVEKREANGNWVVKLPHAERVSAIRTTQREAIGRARELAPEGVIHVK